LFVSCGKGPSNTRGKTQTDFHFIVLLNMFVFLLEMQRGSGRSGRAGRAGKSGKSGKAQGLRQGYVQGGKGVRCQPSERLMRVCVCVCTCTFLCVGKVLKSQRMLLKPKLRELSRHYKLKCTH